MFLGGVEEKDRIEAECRSLAECSWVGVISEDTHEQVYLEKMSMTRHLSVLRAVYPVRCGCCWLENDYQDKGLPISPERLPVVVKCGEGWGDGGRG